MQSGKAQVQEVGGQAADREDKKNPNFQLVNKPSRVLSRHGVLHSGLINITEK